MRAFSPRRFVESSYDGPVPKSERDWANDMETAYAVLIAQSGHLQALRAGAASQLGSLINQQLRVAPIAVRRKAVAPTVDALSVARANLEHAARLLDDAARAVNAQIEQMHQDHPSALTADE